MMEAWTFIDGVKVSVPVDPHDAVKFGWHLGTEFRRWHSGVDWEKEFNRENEVCTWCLNTFGKNTYKVFHDSVYFYREQDAVFCRLKWG